MYHGTPVELNDLIALSAAEISLEYRLPMADSVILASAQANRAVLWTQDVHFQFIPGVNYIAKVNRS